MNADLFYLVVNALAATVVLVHGIFIVVNSMGRQTGLGVRLSWIAMTAGAMGVLVGPLFGRLPPGPSWTSILVGLAISIVFDQRKAGRVLRGLP